MLWISDADGDVPDAERRLADIPGRGADRGRRRTAGLFGIHGDDRDGISGHLPAARIDTRTPFKAEYRVRRADGQYRWVHDHGSPWFDAHGAFMGQMGCCVDITDQRTHQWTARTPSAA